MPKEPIKQQVVKKVKEFLKSKTEGARYKEIELEKKTS